MIVFYTVKGDRGKRNFLNSTGGFNVTPETLAFTSDVPPPAPPTSGGVGS